MTQAATPTALPCAACKQPVIEKRTLDGALVVLDAATKRVHLCVKRKEVEAAKAKQIASSRAREKERPRPAPRPPVKRPVAAAAPPQGRPAAQAHERPRGRASERPKQRRGKATLRTPAQVNEILKGRIVRWRTTDGPTSFCDNCGAPVLAGFSHVRWDVIMVDAAGHRPHDCEVSRQAAAALRAQPVMPLTGVRALPEVETAPRPLAPTAPAAPVATAKATPRRRPAGERSATASSTTCESCGNLKALVNGEWVCLHCA
jgi:hypothetical protein